MKGVGKSLATKLHFQPAARPPCPAWHMSGAQEPAVHTPACCLPACTVLPFHTKCSDEDTKNQKHHHLTRRCGGRMERKREVVISYSLLSPPCYGWSPLEKCVLCRIGLHACSPVCYLHDIAWSQRPWQTFHAEAGKAVRTEKLSHRSYQPSGRGLAHSWD